MHSVRVSHAWKIVCTTVVVGLVGFAYAAKQKFEITGIPIPGVDDAGQAFFEGETEPFSGEGAIKVSVNTKNGKFKGKLSGQAVNDSGESQTFKNDPVVEEGMVDFLIGMVPGVELDITRSKYKVGADGKAKGAGAGTTNFFEAF